MFSCNLPPALLADLAYSGKTCHCMYLLTMCHCVYLLTMCDRHALRMINLAYSSKTCHCLYLLTVCHCVCLLTMCHWVYLLTVCHCVYLLTVCHCVYLLTMCDRHALRVMNLAYSSKTCHYPLSKLQKLLCTDRGQLVELLHACGLLQEEDKNTFQHVNFLKTKFSMPVKV